MQKEEKRILQRIREIQEAQRLTVADVVEHALKTLQAEEAPATKAD